MAAVTRPRMDLVNRLDGIGHLHGEPASYVATEELDALIASCDAMAEQRDALRQEVAYLRKRGKWELARLRHELTLHAGMLTMEAWERENPEPVPPPGVER